MNVDLKYLGEMIFVRIDILHSTLSKLIYTKNIYEAFKQTNRFRFISFKVYC